MPPESAASGDSSQISLEHLISEEIIGLLKTIDINTLTPIEALNALYKLIRKVKP
jgi:hypothetical protein